MSTYLTPNPGHLFFFYWGRIIEAAAGERGHPAGHLELPGCFVRSALIVITPTLPPNQFPLPLCVDSQPSVHQQPPSDPLGFDIELSCLFLGAPGSLRSRLDGPIERLPRTMAAQGADVYATVSLGFCFCRHSKLHLIQILRAWRACRFFGRGRGRTSARVCACACACDIARERGGGKRSSPAETEQQPTRI